MIKLILSLMLLAPLAQAQPRQLSEADAQMVLDCINNVNPDKGELSPVKADECIEKFNEGGGELMDKASRDFPTLAVQALARNNALSDLRDIIENYDRMPMASGLTRVLQERDVLPQMKLGPKPESLNDWVSKHLPGREDAFSHAIRRWDILGDIRIKALSSYTEDSWSALTPADRNMSRTDRYKVLYFLARDKAEELLKTEGMAPKNKAAAADYASLVAVLEYDLEPFNDKKRIARLDKFLKGIGEAAKAEPAGPSAADKKGEALDAAASGLKGAEAGGSADSYLARAFDNAKDSGGDGVALGGKGSKFTPVPITAPQAAELGPRMGQVKDGKFVGAMADDMRGTKAGDEIVTFFEDPKRTQDGTNKLDLRFVKGEGDLENALGWYSSDDKITRINTSVVDKFCADRKITPEQLLKDDNMMKDLATYVNPTFVHETTHQRQDAWSKEKGLKFLRYQDPVTKEIKTFSPYEMEMEAEAFSMNGSFVAEKTQKLGTGYLTKIDRIDREDAEIYLEDGVDGLRKQYHGNSYTQIDSIRGAAANHLDNAQYSAQRVQTLTQKSQQKSSEMTDEEREELRQRREDLDTRFKWYKETLAKSKADEKKLLVWRKTIDPERQVLSTIKMSLLPDTGGEQ